MPRKPEGLRPLTAAERQARMRQRKETQEARTAEVLATLKAAKTFAEFRAAQRLAVEIES